MSDLPGALYEHDGGVFLPTALTRGPWDRGAQHAGPPAALLARAIEHGAGVRPGQAVSLRFDVLRPVPLAPLTVAVAPVRPGRRVEQLVATLHAAGEPVMRCSAWRIRAEAVALPAPAPAQPPPSAPGAGAPAALDFWPDEVAYHRALDWRMVQGGFDEPGDATCWARLLVPLVAGEEPTPLERLLVMADAASGVGAALPWKSWTFANVDLDVHLERPPAGEWMAMAAATRPGTLGAAQCNALLFDAQGRVGTTAQSLLIAPR